MNKEQEIQSIHNLLIHPAGFDIDIQGFLIIRRYEYPRWVIEEFEIGKSVPSFIKEFDDLMEAVKFFVERRYALKLGLDFESES